MTRRRRIAHGEPNVSKAIVEKGVTGISLGFRPLL